MTERSISYTDAMVLQILARRKTKTRRVIKGGLSGMNFTHTAVEDGTTVAYFGNEHGLARAKCRYGKAGDMLYVREAWAVRALPHGYWLEWRAGGDNRRIPDDMATTAATRVVPIGTWKPGVHMFKEYARIWLRVVSIRVERLQNISEADIAAEGIADPHPEEFAALWDSINESPHTWQDNPWVWVVEFEIHE